MKPGEILFTLRLEQIKHRQKEQEEYQRQIKQLRTEQEEQQEEHKRQIEQLQEQEEQRQKEQEEYQRQIKQLRTEQEEQQEEHKRQIEQLQEQEEQRQKEQEEYQRQIKQLQKELEEREREVQQLKADKEIILNKNSELATRLAIQEEEGGKAWCLMQTPEMWEYEGDTGDWVPFIVSMLGLRVFVSSLECEDLLKNLLDRTLFHFCLLIQGKG